MLASTVGNKISPGNPVVKADGTVVRTLWGELAWQLGYATGGAKGAKKAFQRRSAGGHDGMTQTEYERVRSPVYVI